jgi:hypothetical protein
MPAGIECTKMPEVRQPCLKGMPREVADANVKHETECYEPPQKKRRLWEGVAGS